MSTVIASCRIVSGGVFLNGRQWMSFEADDTAANLLAIYRKTGTDYPKFYKMDLLSKASFLGVELLREVYPDLSAEEDDAVGLLFANSESSSDADLKFRESYEKDRLPGPALFVYTLPNIALGEISIRNKWYGEHMFAVFPNFAPAYFVDHGRLMLDDGSRLVVGGWVDVRDKPDVLIFVMARSADAGTEQVTDKLESLYRDQKD